MSRPDLHQPTERAYTTDMTISNEFKSFAVKVRETLNANGLYPDTYELLNIADALYVEPDPQPVNHEQRVQFALSHESTMDYVRRGMKINAIKELRTATKMGLKDSKETVEDSRVWSQSPCPHGLSRDLCETPNGTANDYHYPPDRWDDDEPPF